MEDIQQLRDLVNSLTELSLKQTETLSVMHKNTNALYERLLAVENKIAKLSIDIAKPEENPELSFLTSEGVNNA